jgi:DMSO/TMAO reductase YedYZ heme-binding membrane subunit
LGSHLWWYTARASGLVAWVLVTASVLWGLALASRLVRRPKPAWVLEVHRFLGGASVVFVAVHLLALSLDRYVGFGVEDLFVPMASAWKPDAVAWGIVAFYLLIAVEVTSLLMRRLPRKLWRAVHLTSFAVFGATTVHALLAGTDANDVVVQWLALGSTALVAFLAMFRVLADRRTPRSAPTPSAASAASASVSRPSTPLRSA